MSSSSRVAARSAAAATAHIISSEPWEARRAAPSGVGRCAAPGPCMLRLHYYSDNPALVAADDEESVYSIDLIKEFEAVGRAWKAFLADWLLQGVCLCHPRDALPTSVDVFVFFFCVPA